MNDILVLAMQVVCAIGAVVTMVHAINAINRMSASTDHMIRAAYFLISTGAFGEIMAVFNGHQPGIAEALFVGGIGLLSVSDRRVLRCPLDDPNSPYYRNSEAAKASRNSSNCPPPA